MNKNKIKIYSGGVSVDERGQLDYFNEINFKSIKRFYIVQNHKDKFIRAWHAHKKESKLIQVISGAALICAVKIDNWKKPNKKANVFKKILSVNKPELLFIPKGYANGAMTLTRNTKIMYYSDKILNDSISDDFRYDFDYWNPWEITQR